MIQTFSIFAKQILSFSGFQSSRIPVKVYKAFMTAFQDMLNHDLVMLEPVLKRLKSVPGRLILDDTSNPKYGLKQWTRKLKILSTSGYQDGYKILLFLWDCSLGRIPIGFALWHKATHSLNE